MTDSDLSPARFGTAFKAFMDAVVREARLPGQLLRDRVAAHLEADPAQLPVVVEEFDAYEQPNVQVALDELLSESTRRATLLGIGADHKRFMELGLTDVVGRGVSRPPFAEGPVDYVNFHLAGDRVLACVQCGLYLVEEDDKRFAVFVVGPSDRGGPHRMLRVEVMAAEREDGRAFLAELIAAMDRLNVYRGHVISLSPGQLHMGPQTLVAFHALPTVPRDEVVLPEGVLERIERQTVVFAEQADRLRAAGRSLKRGMLLFGLPGTGKTLTLMHLIGRMPGRTVLLTTGFGMGLLRPVVQMARRLAPSMVVLEDVDLIAEQRGNPFSPAGPLLFELLNEMDGLRDDCDVIFALTTNRADILEPALAARPGRIDLAVELPLPDAAGRRRLLELYSRHATLHDVDWDVIVAQTEGASPAYIKELLRRAILLAVTGDGEEAVTQHHLEAALAELNEGGRLAQRLLGFHTPGEEPPPGPRPPMPPRPNQPTGFPTGVWVGHVVPHQR